MQDICRVPSRPANIPEVSRGRRLPYLDVHATRDRAHGASGSIRPHRPSIERHDASVPTRVHLPPQLRHTCVSRKLRFGTWASPSTSYGCRARTGFPPAVWSPSLSGWLPTTPPQGGSNMGATIASAPKRHQRYLLITLAAAARKADLAPRHYRILPTGDMPRKATSAASDRRPVVTGRCASDRAPDEHRHGAHHRLVGAGPLRVGPAGVRRPRDAPAALDGHRPHRRRAARGTASSCRARGEVVDAQSARSRGGGAQTVLPTNTTTPRMSVSLPPSRVRSGQRPSSARKVRRPSAAGSSGGRPRRSRPPARAEPWRPRRRAR